MASVSEASSAKIHEITSNHKRADPRGILIADVAPTPLGDGDRTETLEESET
jgi:phosphopantothenate synthetase